MTEVLSFFFYVRAESFTSISGTHNGSWTWFEAMIVRGAPWWLPDLEGPAGLPVDLYAEGVQQPVSARAAAAACEVQHPDLERGRWHVTTNITAKREHTEQVITWRGDDEQNTDNSDVPFNNLTERGIAGRQADFVNLIQPGDRVALLAMAKV